jgi:hypothetical protein
MVFIYIFLNKKFLNNLKINFFKNKSYIKYLDIKIFIDIIVKYVNLISNIIFLIYIIRNV